MKSCVVGGLSSLALESQDVRKYAHATTDISSLNLAFQRMYCHLPGVITLPINQGSLSISFHRCFECRNILYDRSNMFMALNIFRMISCIAMQGLKPKTHIVRTNEC